MTIYIVKWVGTAEDNADPRPRFFATSSQQKANTKHKEIVLESKKPDSDIEIDNVGEAITVFTPNGQVGVINLINSLN